MNQRILTFAGVASAAMLLSACESTYQKESPYSKSKWAGAIVSVGERIRNDEAVGMRLMHEKFGPETFVRSLGGDHMQAWWYLKDQQKDQTSLIIAEYEKPDQRVVNAQLIEVPPQVEKRKRRQEGQSYAARTAQGRTIPIAAVRLGLGMETSGKLLDDGRMVMSWPLYPGQLVATTDRKVSHVVRAMIVDD